MDSVLTKIQSNDPVHVIFIATRSGTIKKLSYNPRSQQTCVVEILHPFAEGRSVNIHRWEYNGLYNSFLFPISIFVLTTANWDVFWFHEKIGSYFLLFEKVCMHLVTTLTIWLARISFARILINAIYIFTHKKFPFTLFFPPFHKGENSVNWIFLCIFPIC